MQPKDTTQQTDQNTRTSKPPPLVVYNCNNKIVRQALIENIGDQNFTLKNINKNITQVSINTLANRTIVAKLLKSKELNFYTYTDSDEKPITFLIKNLDNTFEESDIRTALMEMNLQNINILKIYKFNTELSIKNNNDLYMWAVQLSKNSNVEAFKKIEFILNTKIIIEPLKTNKIFQCKNCQRYNHLAMNCNMQYRCIKCAESHEPGKCPLDNLDTIPYESIICANCNEHHIANYRGCIVFKNLKSKLNSHNSTNPHIIKNKNSSNNNSPNQTLIERPTQQSFINKNVSFAQALINNKHSNNLRNNNNTMNYNNNTNNNNFEYINEELKSLFNRDFFSLMNEINSFTSIYKTLNLIEEKKSYLLQFMLNLNASNLNNLSNND